LTRNAIATMYAHVSFDNKEFSLQYITSLLQNMSKGCFDVIKMHERPMLKLFQLQDQYQSDRIKKGVLGINDLLKGNTMFYKYVDSLIDMIYKVRILLNANTFSLLRDAL